MLMGSRSKGPYFFPLTSLQIGDLQSYLSHLSLFLAPESEKFYILVDNRPWLKDLVSRPAHLWQLMVTKSRLSPFANTRRQKEKKEKSEVTSFCTSQKSSTSKSNRSRRWGLLINAATLSQKRALLPVKKLRNSLILNSNLKRTLYGFIVFEVSWSNVRGLNYFNELQTDTSLAVEAKLMNRWEFYSIAQAARFISSWYPGTPGERTLLKEYLGSMIGEDFFDAQENLPRPNCSDIENITRDASDDGDDFSFYQSSTVYPVNIGNRTSILHTPTLPDGPCKRRKVMSSIDAEVDFEAFSGEGCGNTTHSTDECEYETVFGTSQYRDVLLLFRFNDRDLPFKLKEIIMPNLRLLTLLEAGLPSWVIFVQSYPGFCHIYRPWMCPLARALYVLISVVTVLIGFYDLYKNVPLLKATASHLFGPLFDWIETWEMVSRIKYLGTMLFLHNFQKAFRWLLMMTRATQSFVSFLLQPVSGPFQAFSDFFLPLWNMCIELTGSLFSVLWMVIESSYSLVGNVIEILLLPLWYVLSVIWAVATSFLYPIFWILWEILYAPVRLFLWLHSLLFYIYSCIYNLTRDMWLVMSGIFQFSSGVKSTVSSTENSIWRSLWNDLFSQIFRAVRSILNGFVAFFAACNRHRLSIYNHLVAFVRRVHQPSKRLGSHDSCSHKKSGSFVLSHGKQTSAAWLMDGAADAEKHAKYKKVR